MNSSYSIFCYLIRFNFKPRNYYKKYNIITTSRLIPSKKLLNIFDSRIEGRFWKIHQNTGQEDTAITVASLLHEISTDTYYKYHIISIGSISPLLIIVHCWLARRLLYLYL